MELLAATQNNIRKTTGHTVMELLNSKPKSDARLQLLRKKKVEEPDYLVRGNPQLTLRYVTSIKEVDDYFDLKEKGGNCDR